MSNGNSSHFISEKAAYPAGFWCLIHLVGDSQSYSRRVVFSVAAFFLISAGAIIISVIVRPKTPFEREHARAEAKNPPWISVEIRTADNRREYHESEPIKVVANFSSSLRYKYKIEIADGYSESAVEFLHLSNGQTRVLGTNGIACCFSRLVGLDEDPFTPPRVTPLRLAPGTYQIYVTSKRVFMWDPLPGENYQRSLPVASNLLTIKVVP